MVTWSRARVTSSSTRSKLNTSTQSSRSTDRVSQPGEDTRFCSTTHVQAPFIATKMGAIVSGQTSVKAPERAAFEKYLPSDVSIISIHSLHGPTVAPDGQALVSAPPRCGSQSAQAYHCRFFRSSSSTELQTTRCGWSSKFWPHSSHATSILHTMNTTRSLRIHKRSRTQHS